MLFITVLKSISPFWITFEVSIHLTNFQAAEWAIDSPYGDQL